MRATTLSSSLILRAVYDEQGRTLRIAFRNGAIYVYFDVPAAMFEALSAAPSPGAFFNRYIRGRFRCRYDPRRKRHGPRAA